MKCPTCGAATWVRETRDERRTRVCMAMGCGSTSGPEWIPWICDVASRTVR